LILAGSSGISSGGEKNQDGLRNGGGETGAASCSRILELSGFKTTLKNVDIIQSLT
jgi:hypothetical protein